MSQTIVQGMFFIAGMEQTQCIVISCAWCAILQLCLDWSSLDTNASVIIGSLKPLKCKIWQRRRVWIKSSSFSLIKIKNRLFWRLFQQL
jgi:hypothetical protein